MKQAILITAYKDIDQILNIINYFPNNFNFYIHIDKKSDVDLTPLKNIEDKNINVYNSYIVNWGGINHLKAILLMAEEAIKDDENSYFHLISGQDYPAKSIDYFENKLNQTKDYLEFFEMPHKPWGDDGGMSRIEYYNLYDVFDAKRSNNKIQFFIALQKKLRIKRSLPKEFPKFYGGSAWWSLTRDTLQYVLSYAKNNQKLFTRMKYTFAAEEIFFQTIIMNSAYADNVINDNLRYIDWNSGRGGYPAVLDSSDFPEIISSNKLFARKIDTEIAKKLKRLLTGEGGIGSFPKILTFNVYTLMESLLDVSVELKFLFA